MDLTDKYVAWCKYNHWPLGKTTIKTCDSDAPGAFKVFREEVLNQAYNEGWHTALEKSKNKSTGFQGMTLSEAISVGRQLNRAIHRIEWPDDEWVYCGMNSIMYKRDVCLSIDSKAVFDYADLEERRWELSIFRFDGLRD